MSAHDCPCRAAFLLTPEHHDWLLSFEQRGMTGVAEIIDELNTSADSEAGHRELAWVDFPTFVAMHNWGNPFAVRELVVCVVEGIRLRLGLPWREVA